MHGNLEMTSFDLSNSRKPTPQEAVSACRRLYRFAFKKPWKGKVRVVSGNRHTWVYGVELRVNPDRHGGGWEALIQSMAHYCAACLYPASRSWLKDQMVQYATEKGWFRGSLKQKEKIAFLEDIKAVNRKYKNLKAKIKRWETKKKRAETALKKLNKKLRFYEPK